MTTVKQCNSQYERQGGRQPGDRIVECDRARNHDGNHRESLTGSWWPPVVGVAEAPPASDTPPRALTGEEIDAAVGNMSAFEQRTALLFLAGSCPRDFAGAVWYVQRRREAVKSS